MRGTLQTPQQLLPSAVGFGLSYTHSLALALRMWVGMEHALFETRGKVDAVFV